MNKWRRRFVLCMIMLTIAAGGLFAGVYLLRRAYPLRYLDIIRHYSDMRGLDPVLVAALIHAESRFDPRAVSHAGAGGLMQLMPATAAWAAEQNGMAGFAPHWIYDPAINIRLGTWYLARLLNQFGEQRTALAAYNAGSGNVAGWLRNPNYSDDGRNLRHIPFGETRHYLRRIEQNLSIYNVLIWLYDRLP
ncbi:MAG: lytic transglycosylase domain-containing protein [Defluviitaleaceae bacterium]|nr:lytic transglycosylase domain-containing protein [Defluviitaleaceae bacterium]